MNHSSCCPGLLHEPSLHVGFLQAGGRAWEPVHGQALTAALADICTAGTRPLPLSRAVPFMKTAVPLLFTLCPPGCTHVRPSRGKGIN